MKRWTGILVVAVGTWFGLAQHGDGVARRQEDPAPRAAPGSGSIVTLLSRDDVRSTFSFRSGSFGTRIEGGEARLDDADLAYGLFAPGQFTVGFLRDSANEVLDLGDQRIVPFRTPSDRAPKPEISIIHGLRFEGSSLRVAVPPGRGARFAEGERFLAQTPVEGLKHFKPEVGHTYLLHLKPGGLKSREQLVVALEPIEVEEGRFVTFRWVRLR